MIELNEHPLRRQVVGEMHLRHWPAIHAPMLILQLVNLVTAGDRTREASLLETLPEGWRHTRGDNPRHDEGKTNAGHGWVWEHHNEASVFTLFVPRSTPAATLLTESDGELASALKWIARLPGQVMRATRISIVNSDAEAEEILDSFAFRKAELVSCHVGKPPANAPRIWSDFRIAAGQFGQLLIAANDAAPTDLSRLVQRLQELGNYRNLALLGLPVARAGWERLDRIEQELVTFASKVAHPACDDEAMLDRISELSLDLMSGATGNSFRMAATSAYAKLVDERLEELAPRPIVGFQSLIDFTRRRLQPAVRTCAANHQRETELFQKADAFASLLRTRIETRIQAQNASLLQSMNRSIDLQLRMQHLVEGLSVVALSYYCVGLLGYMLGGAEAAGMRIPHAEVLALGTPFIILVVAVGLRRMKQSLLDQHQGFGA
ncbi:MAG: DUF3422 domain-containing protein [Erythrobacter sp.]|jgi:uncharacterized membrane-anchored protein